VDRQGLAGLASGSARTGRIGKWIGKDWLDLARTGSIGKRIGKDLLD
jgi:hypothetical protein